MPGDKTLKEIERLKRLRANRRKSAEAFKRARDDESRQRPGDVDFQRMIRAFRSGKICKDSFRPHEQVGSLKINVVVRKRPISGSELRKKDFDAVTCSNPHVFVHHCKFKVDGITKYLDNTGFEFDHAFGEGSTNDEIYTYTAKDLVLFALNGGRATCFAYGQTGSGKTFTMAGVQKAAAADIFELLSQHPEANLKVTVAFFELYGGRCLDLLHERTQCPLREDGKGRVQIEGLNEVEVRNMDDLLSEITRGNDERTTHATEMNNVSSRSHAICQIFFRDASSYSREPFGKLSLIDLAGSERGQDTRNHNRQRRKESADINKSLLALKECFRAMDSNNIKNASGHVPYRQSKLTMVLKDSFSPAARTVMISCVSPSASSSDHTLNTLRYADRVKEKRPNSAGGVSVRSFRAKKKVTSKSTRRTTLHLADFSNERSVLEDEERITSRSRRRAMLDERESSSVELMQSSSSRSGIRRDMDLDETLELELEETYHTLPGIEDEVGSDQEASIIKSAIPSEPSYKSGKEQMMVDAGNEDSEKENHLQPEDMELQKLVDKLVKEEETMLNAHWNTIERRYALLQIEGNILQLVNDGTNGPDAGCDVEEYMKKMDEILSENKLMMADLEKKIQHFRRSMEFATPDTPKK